MIKISTSRIASKMKFTSVIFLSIFLSFSHLNSYQVFAQDSDPVDNSVVSNGEKIFKGNCTVCHAINDVVIGPALRDVHERRSEEWLYAFIRNSQKVIQSGDEYAVNLYKEYNNTLMTSFDFNDEELSSILEYIKSESAKPIEVAVVAEGSDEEISSNAQSAVSNTTVNITGFSQGPWSNSRGQTVLTRTGAGNWRMDNDIYAQNYNFPSGYTSTLDTNGFRLFVMDTLTTQSTTTIHNDGANGSIGGDVDFTAGAAGAGGAGGGGGNLSSGQAGSPGGAGGARADEDAVGGAGGGGGGGSGGFVFIAARNISNSGTIRSHGGTGGRGGASDNT